MNRQYIGARYVPVYFNHNGSAEWVSGISYEPLTIVKYLDRTYTSTKPVPSNVGTPNVNTNYWVESGDTQTINNLINEIGNVDAKVDNLTLSTNTHFGQIDNAIGTINNDIDAINARIGVGKKYIFVGDSYSVMNVGWLAKLTGLMGLTSSDYYNCCVSGSAFTSQTDATKWFNMITTLVNGFTDDEKNSISDVVCVGGINDSLPYNQFPNCANDDEALVYTVDRINEFASFVANNLPFAKVHLFYVGNTEEGMDSLGQRYYSNIIRTICAWQNASWKNLTCYKGSECILHTYSLMADDGIHPNENGCTMIARFVLNCLNGGDGIDIIDGFHTTSLALTTGSGPVALFTNGTLKYTIINNMVNISLNGSLSCDMGEVITYTDGSEIVIGAFSNPNTIHGKKVEFETDVLYSPAGSANANRIASASLILDKGVLKLKIWKLSNDWAQTTSTAMKWLIVHIPNISYPLVQN